MRRLSDSIGSAIVFALIAVAIVTGLGVYTATRVSQSENRSTNSGKTGAAESSVDAGVSAAIANIQRTGSAAGSGDESSGSVLNIPNQNDRCPVGPKTASGDCYINGVDSSDGTYRAVVQSKSGDCSNDRQRLLTVTSTYKEETRKRYLCFWIVPRIFRFGVYADGRGDISTPNNIAVQMDSGFHLLMPPAYKSLPDKDFANNSGSDFGTNGPVQFAGGSFANSRPNGDTALYDYLFTPAGLSPSNNVEYRYGSASKMGMAWGTFFRAPLSGSSSGVSVKYNSTEIASSNSSNPFTAVSGGNVNFTGKPVTLATRTQPPDFTSGQVSNWKTKATGMGQYMTASAFSDLVKANSGTQSMKGIVFVDCPSSETVTIASGTKLVISGGSFITNGCNLRVASGATLQVLRDITNPYASVQYPSTASNPGTCAKPASKSASQEIDAPPGDCVWAYPALAVLDNAMGAGGNMYAEGTGNNYVQIQGNAIIGGDLNIGTDSSTLPANSTLANWNTLGALFVDGKLTMKGSGGAVFRWHPLAQRMSFDAATARMGTYSIRTEDKALPTRAPSITWDPTSLPAKQTSSNSANFRWTIDGTYDSVTCVLSSSSGNKDVDCTDTSATLADLDKSMTYTFTVKACTLGVDENGNQTQLCSDSNALKSSYSWYITGPEPSISITDKPSLTTASRTASFNWTLQNTNSATTVMCKIDPADPSEAPTVANGWSACASPPGFTQDNLTTGSHTFVVSATNVGTLNGSGNSRASYTWTVSNVPKPEIQITSAPDSALPYGTTSVSFAWTVPNASSANADSATCQVDNDPAVTNCTSPYTVTNPDPGEHTFVLIVCGSSGCVTSTTKFTVNPPKPSNLTWVTQPTNPQVYDSNSPANAQPSIFNWTADGAASYSCKLDGGSWDSCNPPVTQQVTACDEHTFYIKASNASGDTGPITHTWTVKCGPPDSPTIATKPDQSTYDHSADFTFSANHTPTRYECKFDDAASWTTCTSPKNYPNLTDGQHTFQVRGCNEAGCGDSASYDWTVLALPKPTTTITGKPANPSDSTETTATFKWTVEGQQISRVECKLDSGDWATCDSKNPENSSEYLKTYNNLSTNATHTFQVRGCNGGNNTDNCDTETYTWVIYPPKPDVSWVPNTGTPPSEQSYSQSPQWDFKWTVSPDSVVTSTTCQLDDGEITTNCSSPKPVTYTACGNHTFVLTVSNQAGSTKLTYTWRVKCAPATVEIDANNKPGSPSKEISPTIGWKATGSGIDVTECKLEKIDSNPTNTIADWSDCRNSADPTSGSKRYNNLSRPGKYRFTVRVSNESNVASPATASYEWYVTPARPRITFDDTSQENNSSTRNTKPSYSWTVEGEAPVESVCVLNDGTSDATVSCSDNSYTPPSGLSAGTYTLKVTARYTAAGLSSDYFESPSDRDSLTASRVVTILPPVITNLTGPSGDIPANQTSKSFTYQIEGEPLINSTPTCQLQDSVDNITWSTVSNNISGPCLVTGSPTYSGLIPGHYYRFSITATTSAGSDTQVQNFHILSNPPTVSMISPADGSSTRNTKPTFEWLPASDYEVVPTCQLIDPNNQTSNVDCSGTTFTPSTGLSAGTYTFRVKVTDIYSQESTWASTSITILAPSVSVTSGPSGVQSYDSTTAQFGFTYEGTPLTSGPTCVLQVSNNGSTGWSTSPATSSGDCASGSSPSYSNLQAGKYYRFAVTVATSAGSTTSAYREFNLKPTPPTVQIDPPFTGTKNSRNPLIVWTQTSTDTLTPTCTLDGQTVACSGAIYQASSLTDGSHTFKIEVADTFGQKASDTNTWTVDATAPTAILTAPNSPTNSSSLVYTLQFSESVTGVASGDFQITGTASGWSVDSISGSGDAYTITLTGGSEGTIGLAFAANGATDQAGNTGPSSAATAATVTVDRTAPSALWTPPSSPTNSSSLSYILTFSESVSGITSGDFSNAGTATGCAFSPSAASGSSITVTVSGCSEGTVVARLSSNGVTDTAGNTGPTANTDAASVTIDRTAPTANWTAPSSPTNSASLSYTLQFSEAVSGIAAGDFTNTGTATGCVFTPSASSGTSITVTVSGCSEGTVVARISSDSVVDAAGNTGPSSNTDAASVTVDRTAPTASWSPPSSPTNSSSLVYTLQFSESVSGIAAGDFANAGTATGCTFTPSSASGTAITVTISGCSEGTVVARLLANGVTDTAGNNGPLSDTDAVSVTIDRTKPTASWTPPSSPNNSSNLSYTLTFSESVSGIASGDFSNTGTATGCTFTPSAASGSSITVTVSGCSEGTVIARLSADSIVDAAGNTGPASNTDAASVTVDRTAPTVASFTTATTSPSNATSLTYTLTLSEAVAKATGAQLGTADISINGTANAGWVVSSVTPTSPSGNYATVYTIVITNSSASDGTVYPTLAAASVRDAAGNTGPAADSNGTSITIDRTAPGAPTLVNKVPDANGSLLADGGYTNQTGSSISWSAVSDTSGIARYECSINGGTSYTTCTSPQVRTSLAEGAYSLKVRAVDNAGNNGTVATLTWTVDTTAPATPTITQLTTPTNNNNQTVSFTTAESAGTVECKLDSGAWGACTTYSAGSGTYATGVLADGSHTFSVRHTDLAGNVSAAGSMTWVIDTVAPALPTLSGLPTSPTSSTTASVSISGEANATFQCSVDGGAFSTCTSPKSFSGLTEGLHSLVVRQTDQAGNQSSATTYSTNVSAVSGLVGYWKLDETSGTTATDSKGSYNGTYLNSPTLGQMPLINAGNSVKLNGTTQYVNVPYNAALNTSQFTFETWFTQNASASAATQALIGTESGTVASFKGILLYVNSNFMSTEMASSSNGVQYLNTGSNTVLKGRTYHAVATYDGTTLKLYLDGVLKSSAARTFTANTSSAQTIGAGLNSSNSPQYRFNGNIDEAAIYNRALSASEISANYTAGATGRASWTVDTTAPSAPVITGTPASPTNSTSATLSFTGENASTVSGNPYFTCSLDGAAYSACSSSKALTGLADGSHTFSVKETDAAGNTSPAGTTTWTVDTTAPTASWTTVPSTPTNSSSLSYTVTFSEAISGFTNADLSNTGTATGCSFAVGTATGNAYPVTVTGCSEGTVILNLAAAGVTDTAGNTGPATAAVASSVTIDRTAPTATWTPPSSPTNSANLSYTLTFSESVSGIAAADFTNTGTATGCVFTPSASSGTSITVTVSSCSEGTVVVRLLANGVTDTAGNAGPTSNTDAASVTIDRTAPTATWTPPSSPTNSASLSYTLQFSEAVSGIAAADFSNTGTATGCVFTPSAASGTSITVTVSSCSEGTVVARLLANGVTDTAGNTGPTSNTDASSVTIDRTAPTATWTPPSSPTNSSNLSYTLQFSEAVSGIAAGDFSNTGTATGCVFTPSATSGTSITVTVSSCSEGTVIARLLANGVTDTAGNTGPAANTDSSSVTIDRTKPTATLSAPSSPTNSTTLSYTLTFSESVSGLVAGDFQITGTASGWSVSSITGSGTNYTVVLSGGGEGSVDLSLSADSVVDTAGNTGPQSTAAASSVTVDRTAPTVSSFTTATTSPSNTTSLTYTLTFTSTVTGLTASDLSVGGTATGWSIGTVTGSGTSYTVTLTSSSPTDGTVYPVLAANSVADTAGNNGPISSANGTAITIDRTAPTVSSFATLTSSPSNATNLSYTLQFSESVSGLTAANISVAGTATGWSVASLTGSGTTYTVNLSSASPTDGTVYPVLAAGSATDQAGNTGPATVANGTTITIDLTAPTATWTAPSSPTNSASLSYTLTFSESVSGIAAADFTNTGTATGCSFTPSAASGTSITVTVSSCSEGTVVVRLLANGVTDTAGNTGPTSNTDAASVTIDRTAPTATWTPPSSPTNSASLSYTLQFSESVSGIAAGDFSNTGTATGCVFTPSAASGTSITVTVASCSEGTVVARLLANGVTDTAGNTGPTSNTDAASVTIDRSAPTATWTVVPNSPTNSTSLSYTVVFSEAVSGIVSADFTNTGTATGCVFTPSASSGTSVDITVSGCSEGTLVARLISGSVADASGNAGPSANADASAVTIDRTAPGATINAPSSPTNASNLNFGVTFTESVLGITAGDFSNAGTATGCVFTPSSPSGTSVTVTAASCSEGTVVLRLGLGSVTDTAGNTGPTANVDSSTVTVDRTAPTPSSFTRTDASGSPVKTLTGLSYTLQFSEAVATSGIASSSFTNAGTATSCTFTPTAVAASGGYATSYTVAVSGCANSSSATIQPQLKASQGTDTAGNASSSAAYTSATSATAPINPVVYDTTGPSVSSFIRTDGGSQYLSDLSNVVYTITFSEPVASSSFVASDLSNTGTATSCTFTPTAVSPSNGMATSYTITVTNCVAATSTGNTVQPQLASNSVTDEATNTGPSTASTSSSTAITYDTTAPSAMTITGVTNGASTTTTNPSLTFSGEANATYTCSLDGAAYSACTSPRALSSLAATPAPHTFAVKQTDQAGNTSTVPSDLSTCTGTNGCLKWTVTAPTASVTGGSGSSTGSGQASTSSSFTLSLSPTAANGLTNQTCDLEKRTESGTTTLTNTAFNPSAESSATGWSGYAGASPNLISASTGGTITNAATGTLTHSRDTTTASQGSASSKLALTDIGTSATSVVHRYSPGYSESVAVTGGTTRVFFRTAIKISSSNAAASFSVNLRGQFDTLNVSSGNATVATTINTTTVTANTWTILQGYVTAPAGYNYVRGLNVSYTTPSGLTGTGTSVTSNVDGAMVIVNPPSYVTSYNPSYFDLTTAGAQSAGAEGTAVITKSFAASDSWTTSGLTGTCTTTTSAWTGMPTDTWYRFSTTATSSAGSTTSAYRYVNVYSATPTVAISSPSAGASVSDPTVTWSSTGKDVTPSCSIDSVATPCASSTTWSPPSGLSMGSHTFSVYVTDTYGQISSTASVTFTVTQPTITFNGTSPAQDSHVDNTSQRLQWSSAAIGTDSTPICTVSSSSAGGSMNTLNPITNLVLNPAFGGNGSVTSNWGNGQSATVFTMAGSSDGPVSGGGSILFTAATSPGNTVSANFSTNPAPASLVNKTVTASVWVKVSNAGYYRLRIGPTTLASYVWSTATTSNPQYFAANTWTKVVFAPFTLNSNYSSVTQFRFQMYRYAGSTTASGTQSHTTGDTVQYGAPMMVEGTNNYTDFSGRYGGGSWTGTADASTSTLSGTSGDDSTGWPMVYYNNTATYYNGVAAAYFTNLLTTSGSCTSSGSPTFSGWTAGNYYRFTVTYNTSTGPISATRQFRIKPVAPTVTNLSLSTPSVASGGYSNSTTQALTWTETSTDTLTRACTLDGVSTSCSAGSASLTGLSNGSHTFSVTVTDLSSQTATSSISWTVDTVKPTASWISPSSPTNSNSLSYTLAFSESVSGIASGDFTNTGTATGCSFTPSAASGSSITVTVSGCSEGTVIASLSANGITDQAGNTGPSSAAAAGAVTVDRTAPTATWTAPSSPTNSASLSYTLTFSESVSGIATADFTNTGTATGCSFTPSAASGTTVTVTVDSCSEGTVVMNLAAAGVTDTAGNTGPSSAAVSSSVTVDRSAPSVSSFTTSTTSPSNATSLSYTITFSESVTGLAAADFSTGGTSSGWSVGTVSGSGTTYTVGLTSTSPTNGTIYPVMAQNGVTDSSGNTGPSPSSNGTSITIDRTAPSAPTITSPINASYISSTSQSVIFTGEASASFTCSVDGGAYSSCTSPKSLTGLSEGSHTVDIKQTDQAGNTSTAATTTWTVDTTAPSAPVLSGAPSTYTNSTSASISFTGEANASFTCSVDGGAYSSCSSPKSITGLSDGAHSLSVKQTDQAGNTSAAATASWTVDTGVPTAPSLSGAPSSYTSSTSASISFTGEANASFTCSVDGGAYSSCTSPKSLSALSDGAHSLSVKQTDQAGNTSAAATASWTVDTTPPSAPVLSGAPSTYTNSTSASISFTGEANAAFTCSVDGGAYSSCSSPKSLSALAEGAHSLAVKQTDQAGNTSAAATASWTVDTGVPSAPSLSGAPSAYTNSTSASISFTGEANAAFTCSVDGGAYSSCTSPKSLSALADGAHSLAVKQTDQAGNTSAAATASWTVDTGVPSAPSLSGAPSSPTNSTSASISFTGEANASFTCSVDGGAYSSCTSPKSLTGLAEGAHSLSVKQTDQAGNTSAAATASWTVDTTPAAAPTISSKPTNPTTSNNTSSTASFTFSAAEAGGTMKCQLDGGTWATCTSSTTYTTAALSYGSHTVNIRQDDTAGNTGTSATWTWYVDPTAPSFSVTAFSNNTGNSFTNNSTTSYPWNGAGTGTYADATATITTNPTWASSAGPVTTLLYGTCTNTSSAAYAAGNSATTAGAYNVCTPSSWTSTTPSNSYGQQTVTSTTVNSALDCNINTIIQLRAANTVNSSSTLSVTATSGSTSATLSSTLGLQPSTTYIISSTNIPSANYITFTTGASVPSSGSYGITLSSSSGVTSGTATATIKQQVTWTQALHRNCSPPTDIELPNVDTYASTVASASYQATMTGGYFTSATARNTGVSGGPTIVNTGSGAGSSTSTLNIGWDESSRTKPYTDYYVMTAKTWDNTLAPTFNAYRTYSDNAKSLSQVMSSGASGTAGSQSGATGGLTGWSLFSPNNCRSTADVGTATGTGAISSVSGTQADATTGYGIKLDMNTCGSGYNATAVTRGFWDYGDNITFNAKQILNTSDRLVVRLKLCGGSTTDNTTTNFNQTNWTATGGTATPNATPTTYSCNTGVASTSTSVDADATLGSTSMAQSSVKWYTCTMGRGTATADNFQSNLNVWSSAWSNLGYEYLSGYSLWNPSSSGGALGRQNGIPAYLQFQAYNGTVGSGRGMYLDNLSSTGAATATLATPCV